MEGTLNGGKKWAKGTGVSSSSKIYFTTSNASTAVDVYYVDIKLDFTPSSIIASGTTGYSFESLSVLNNLGSIFSIKNVKVTEYSGSSSSPSVYNLKVDEKIDLGNNLYRIPVYTKNLNIDWVAYE